MSKIDLPKQTMWKAAALAAGLALAMLSCPVHAAPTSGGDTVQGLYDALLAESRRRLRWCSGSRSSRKQNGAGAGATRRSAALLRKRSRPAQWSRT